jgi:hypothetical protein
LPRVVEVHHGVYARSFDLRPRPGCDSVDGDAPEAIARVEIRAPGGRGRRPARRASALADPSLTTGPGRSLPRKPSSLYVEFPWLPLYSGQIVSATRTEVNPSRKKRLPSVPPAKTTRRAPTREGARVSLPAPMRAVLAPFRLVAAALSSVRAPHHASTFLDILEVRAGRGLPRSSTRAPVPPS